jgi:hypothetical protein
VVALSLGLNPSSWVGADGEPLWPPTLQLVGQTVHMALDGADGTVLSDADLVSLWLMSAEGQRVVARTLRDLKLPSAFDADLVISVCHSADQMAARGVAIESIPAWATRTLRLRAIDLVRSPRSSRVQMGVGPDGEDLAFDVRDPADAIASSSVEIDASDVRRRLGTSWGRLDGWQVSAALTVLSVLYDEADPGVGCPQPVGGASEHEAAHWVGLWYSGRRDLFPGPDIASSNTLTKRRSRASSAVKQLLRSAAQSEEGEGRNG